MKQAGGADCITCFNKKEEIGMSNELLEWLGDKYISMNISECCEITFEQFTECYPERRFCYGRCDRALRMLENLSR